MLTNNIYAPATLSSDAILTGWRKNPGDYFTRDETLADIDEAAGVDQLQRVFEVSIPVKGKLAEIIVPTGSAVAPNQVIATYYQVTGN